MSTQDSGPAVWDAIFTRPVGDLNVSPEARHLLLDQLVFEPEPYVGRLVFVAGVHRGSPFANRCVGRLFGWLVVETEPLNAAVEEAVRAHGRGVLQRQTGPRRLDGIDGLRVNDPVLNAINHLPTDPAVPYHSIIPQLWPGLIRTDGVVPYWSSHLDGAASEYVYRGWHTSHDSPLVTAEIRRILLEHLAALDAGEGK
jgi:hypothetical protein